MRLLFVIFFNLASQPAGHLASNNHTHTYTHTHTLTIFYHPLKYATLSNILICQKEMLSEIFRMCHKITPQANDGSGVQQEDQNDQPESNHQFCHLESLVPAEARC